MPTSVNPFADLIPNQGAQGEESPQNNMQQTANPNPGGSVNPFEDLIPQQKQQQKQSTFMDMVDSFNDKVTKLSAGALQGIGVGLNALGVDTTKFNQNVENFRNTNQQYGEIARANSPIATKFSDAAGDLTNIGYTAAAGGTAGAGAIMGAPTVLGRVGGSAALSAAEGMLEYGSLQERFDKGTMGAALGALGQGAGESIAHVAKNAVGPLFKAGIDEAAEKINHGAKMTLGQATERPVLQKAEATLAEVPGLGAKSNIQNAATSLTAQTQDILGSLGVNKQKAAVLAKDLKTGLAQAKDDAFNKTNAAYDDVLKTSDELGIKVPLANSNKVAQEIFSEINAGEAAGLKSFKMDLNSNAAKIIDDLANQSDLSGKFFDGMRKKLKGAIDDAHKGKGDSELIEPLKQLKGAMDEDLNALADAGNPLLKEKLLTARATHQTLKEPFNQDPFLKKLKKGEYVNPDHLLNSAIKNDSPYATSLIMKTLPKETQETFTTALIQKAVRRATSDGKLDLGRLNKNLDGLGETLDAIPGPAQAKVKGIQKLITEGDYILKAAQPSSIGYKLGGSGAAWGAMGTAFFTSGIGAALGVGAGLKGLSTLLTNPSMVKQLVRLGGGKLNPQTTKETVTHIINKGLIPAAASSRAETEAEKNKAR